MSAPLFTRSLSTLIAASIALTLSGCDTEKGASPQPAEKPGASSPQSSGSASRPRYQVDRSQAGTPIADTQVRGPDGMLRSLRSLAGRPVVLNLWATWCAPCVEELPTLNALATQHRGTANIVALSQDIGEAATPNAFLTERGWQAIQSWHDPDNVVGLSAGGNLPTTILYGADGQEVLRVVGPLDWAGAEAGRLLSEIGL